MRRAVRWGIPVLVALLAIAYLGVSFLMASGVTKADRKPLTTDPSAYGLPYEDVQFSPRDGDLTLKGWYVPAQPKGPVVILVHGHNSNREEDGEFLDLSTQLVKRGLGVLLFDLRAHGASEGKKVSGGYFEREDLLGAFDHLVKRGIPADNIGVLGFSMGAATTLLALAEEPGIGAAVVDSPYADVSDMIAQETARQTVFPEWLVPVFVPGMKPIARFVYGIDLSTMVPEESVARLDYPILVIHGTADERIPVEHGVRVHMAAQSGSELWLVPGVGHTDAFVTYPEEYADRVAAYFNSRLGRE